jgi:hypothetical protein
VREKRVALENCVHWTIVRFGGSYILAANEHLARGCLIQTRNDSQSRGLSATRRTQQGEKLTRWNLQIKVLNCSKPRELLADSN